MLKTLLIKELMGAVLDRKYPVYFILVTVLTILSVTVRMQEYRDKQENYRKLDDVFNQQALAAPNIRRLATGGLKIAMPPAPLQALSRGTAGRFSEFATISLASWSKEPYPFLRTEKFTNPALAIFPVPDFPFIVMFIISLIVLVFSHNTVSRERESGTLRLMMSYRVSRAGVILAKTVSGYLVIAFPVVFSLVGILLLGELTPWFAMTGTMVTLIACIGVSSLLYLLILFLMGVLVSTLCHRSATAIAVLLLVWLIFIVVVHNISIMAYERSATGVSVERVLELKERQQGNKLLWEQMDADIQKELGLKKGEKPNWRKLKPEQHVAVALIQIGHMNRNVTGTVENYINELERNYRRLLTAGYVSPSLLYLSSVTELAGTGIGAHIRLLRSIVEYQNYFKGVLDDSFKKQLEKPEENKDKPPTQPYNEMQQYRAPDMSVGTAWTAVAPQWLAMCVYAVLFFMLGFVAFIKKDIT